MTMVAWEKMKAETLAHALVQYKNGKKGVLHFHYSDIPMEKLPFFQIFGPKVSGKAWKYYCIVIYRERLQLMASLMEV